VIDVTAGDLVAGSAPAIPLEAGDVIRVPPVSERVRNRIWVQGSVWAPGSVGYVPGMLLSQALRLAGGLQPDAYLGKVLVTRLQPDSSRRQLRASLRDSTGAAISDLVLQEDDEVQVFSSASFLPDQYVAIAGAVQNGGRFPYRSGMTMRDLVLLAGGFDEGAYLVEAEIARLPEQRSQGATAVTMRVPLDSSLLFAHASRHMVPLANGHSPGATPGDVPLQPHDNVLILREPGWELQRMVVITGEVRFPGRYALLTKYERVSDLIARAGGFQPQAYPNGVFFYRKRDRIGRIGIDLPRILKSPRIPDNLILQDADSIHIPTYSAVVNVTGSVNSPVAVAYVAGKDLNYYVRAAGGGSRRADPKRAYVTQPNGKVESIKTRPFLPDRIPEPGAGSVVFVPEREPGEKRDYSGLATASAQVLASVVALVAILRR
jgi:protein involved in polysaccharide export with SLBB domain